ncbi:MAG: hypothetical protein A3J63_04680 [Candidatus Moranbacteria bacterium RIFCSPHIGHO2_02_FULL_40_12b]|nr:MAG: hypothetical protein A3J63_04680 [Candidatus Moranbacteria bacterium RIFCSPHIGHO2_02_FULL_40_12b]
MSGGEKKEEKKSLASRLKGLVFETVEEGGSAEVFQPVPNAGGEKPADVTMDTENVYVPSSMANSEQVEELRRKIRSRGKILADFLATVEELKDTIPDEAQRYVAVDKARKDFGPEDLLYAAKEQLDEIDIQSKEFDDAVKEVGAEAERLEKDAGSINLEIEGLRQRIAQLEEKKREISAKARTARSKAESGKAKFEAASKIVKSEIETIIRKINQYLKGGK